MMLENKCFRATEGVNEQSENENSKTKIKVAILVHASMFFDGRMEFPSQQFSKIYVVEVNNINKAKEEANKAFHKDFEEIEKKSNFVMRFIEDWSEQLPKSYVKEYSKIIKSEVDCQ